MENVNLYYKYIIRPQFMLKFPKIKDSKELSNIVIRKIRMYMYFLDIKKNYYLYLYNICILMRLVFNKFVYIKKVKNYYTLNEVVIQLSLEDDQIYMFLDVFGTILLPSFESFNMGLKKKDFDMFGNYTFEFNYCDPIFTSKNTILVWSPNNKIKIIFYFKSKEKMLNMLLLRYLNCKYNFLKETKKNVKSITDI